MVETMNANDLATKARPIAQMLLAEHKDELTLFRDFLANFFGSKSHPLSEAVEQIKQIETMLATQLKQIKQEWLERGIEEGIEKGREEGEKKRARRPPASLRPAGSRRRPSPISPG